MKLDVQQLMTYAGVALGAVLTARYFSSHLYNLLDHFLFRTKDKRDPSLDEMIDQKHREFGGYGLRKSGATPLADERRSKGAPTPEELLRLTEDLSPEAQQRKLILQKIYSFDSRRMPSETERNYYLRLINERDPLTMEILKKAYKQKAREFHPDTFDLALFDEKMKKKLRARIHENYLHIQRANEYLKKNL
jgi:hypothetical protein